jgi:glycosyltransferase involved in cell wall biosynthesis
MLSVLIPTLNERQNLADCLASVAWADELVVVDSGSTDGTQEIARQAGAHLVDFNWNGRLPKKKNWALENIAWKSEWVLILDADERITLDLGAEIRRFMFLGRWIRHCDYYPSWNLRLFRHRKGRYENLCDGDTGSGDNEVHEHIMLKGSTTSLQKDMLHFAYPDICTWVEKHNRYSNWEARIETGGQNGASPGEGIGSGLARRRRLREWSRRVPFRPMLRFFYSYILKRGFLDGREGYMFCRLLATYEMMSVFKAYELRSSSTRKG